MNRREEMLDQCKKKLRPRKCKINSMKTAEKRVRKRVKIRTGKLDKTRRDKDCVKEEMRQIY